ncbi:coiled-coil domain-containing protein 74B-like [Elgaria multicarinata webbii]|uniref:coiled-coil domain-containing protein 74B-like n=1 Tax=Elgaria multicarinata webbii TaxID=159646 RepID=UPI002FCD296B
MQTGSGFPPLGNLPHWSRVGQPERGGWSGAAAPPHHPPPPAAAASSGAETWRRAAADLERSLKFLQQQHAETLQKLHQEIDLLKRQNQDLHYQLIMHPVLQKTDFFSSTLSGKSHRRSSSKRKTACSLKIAEEQREKDLLGSEELEKKHINGEFAKDEASMEEASAEEASAEEASAEEEVDSAVQKGSKVLSPQPEESPPELPPLLPPRDSEVCDRMTSPIPPSVPAASSNPFLVNILPSQMRKPPTLEECEVVIRQLWNINHMQMQELMYLRSCLEDIHKTKRIPEDYMLAGQLGSQETTRFPRVKNVPKKCRILTPLPAAERAVLPALKQTLGNAFAERQKRAQAVQRNRLHRTAL